MTPGLVWLLTAAAFFLALCLLTVFTSASTALVVVGIAVVIGLATWQRDQIGKAAKALGHSFEQWLERRREANEAKAQRRQEAEQQRQQAVKEYARKRELTHFHTKVVGVTKDNKDGSSRQSAIKRCRLWEQLNLQRDKGNRHDRNAIAVLRGNGSQLGYLSSEVAEELASTSTDGYFYTAYVSNLTGGSLSKPTRGCNLLIVLFESSIPTDVVIAYAESVLSKDD